MWRKINAAHIIITIIISIVGTALFYNWYTRPIVLIDIKEYDLPRVYAETMGDKISEIPRITIIEINNIGKSMGNKLSIDFKTNEYKALRDLIVESRSDVLKYSKEDLKDGSSLIKVDMEYIRPNEKIIIKALTDTKSNFFISQKLIANGEIIKKENYENRKSIITSISGILVGVISAFILSVINHKIASNSVIIRMFKKIIGFR